MYLVDGCQSVSGRRGVGLSIAEAIEKGSEGNSGRLVVYTMRPRRRNIEGARHIGVTCDIKIIFKT